MQLLTRVDQPPKCQICQIRMMFAAHECPLRSKTDILRSDSDVRFTPESGHVQCKQGCPLWAKSGHRDDYERSGSNAAARGKITLISVNSPGSVSTSIEPPCCFTMMS